MLLLAKSKGDDLKGVYVSINNSIIEFSTDDSIGKKLISRALVNQTMESVESSLNFLVKDGIFYNHYLEDKFYFFDEDTSLTNEELDTTNLSFSEGFYTIIPEMIILIILLYSFLLKNSYRIITLEFSLVS